MSSPKQGKILLSDTERERLFDQNLDSTTRKRNHLIVKRKIKNWISQAEDVVYALRFLTDTQIEQTIPDGDVFALFEATEMILDRLNFAPVHGEPDNPFVTYAATVLRSDPKGIRRRAKESDFDRALRVQRHAENLRDYYLTNDKYDTAYKIYHEKGQWKLDHPGAEPFPDQATRWEKAKVAIAESKRKAVRQEPPA